MNELVRQQKQDYLAGLKNARATVEQKVAVRESEIFSQKLTIVQDQERQLDEALDKFIQEENEKLKAAIEDKKSQVADKKARLNSEASRVSHELASQEVEAELAEIDKEIAKVTSELGV